MTSYNADFDAFYRATFEKVLKRAYLAYGNYLDIPDAVQDAYVYVLEHWTSLADRSEEDRQWYVMRAVINGLHSSRRRWKVHQKVIMQLGIRAAPDPLQYVEQEALVSNAGHVIRNLPERQRVIVAMHLLDEVPLTEIAAALGISASAARTHLKRARATIAKKLGTQAVEGIHLDLSRWAAQ